MNKREPEFDEARDGTERATQLVEEERLPLDNEFADIVRKLHDRNWNWTKIHNHMEEVYAVVDKAASEEMYELIPDWKVAVVECDRNSTSGERYEYYERTAETAEEAEQMVENHTGCPVVPEKTEQIGVSKVF